MYNIMKNSVSAMSASQGKIEITSNNMVNAQTTGYKKLDIGFLDLYNETLDRSYYPHNNNNNTGTGVKVSQSFRNLSQGAIKDTGIKSNLAIDGDGFFRVINPNGTFSYTRNGEFNVDSNGDLVDDKGNKLDIQVINGNDVDLSKGEVSINKLGEIFVDKEEVGKINLYKVQGDKDFIPAGDNLFNLRDGAKIELVTNSNILQGYVEMSNVNMETEMTDLIIAQRSFQFNSKGLQATDDMWSMINNLQSR